MLELKFSGSLGVLEPFWANNLKSSSNSFLFLWHSYFSHSYWTRSTISILLTLELTRVQKWWQFEASVCRSKIFQYLFVSFGSSWLGCGSFLVLLWTLWKWRQRINFRCHKEFSRSTFSSLNFRPMIGNRDRAVSRWGKEGSPICHFLVHLELHVSSTFPFWNFQFLQTNFERSMLEEMRLSLSLMWGNIVFVTT